MHPALEIDSVQPAPAHRAIAAEIREHWTDIMDKDWLTLKDAKPNLVCRPGDAARTAERERTAHARLEESLEFLRSDDAILRPAAVLGASETTGNELGRSGRLSRR